MAIVDANSGKVRDAPSIGRGSDATAKLAFSSDGDGTLNVISAKDATHYALKQTVNTMAGARTMVIDSVSHKVYLVAAETEPAEASAQQKPSRRGRLKPDTFTLITVSP